ncbi:fidgetin-like protein 1 [Amphiura filiformis]|uniref:fidgetin-like protein 1 n=1 Tax=Amphiura filiformis TaxID=82378 RepID=UPI003B2267A1
MTDVNKTEAFALHRWQKSHFTCTNETDTSPGQRADALRGIVNQIYVARASNSLPEESQCHLTQDYLRLYSSIVDSCNTQSGLNNYAEGALALCANKPNESASWQSSLTPDNIGSLKCVQDLISASKLSASAKVPANCDEVLHLKTKQSANPKPSQFKSSIAGPSHSESSGEAGVRPPNHNGQNFQRATSDDRPNPRNPSNSYGNQAAAPLFRKMDQPTHAGFGGGQFNSGNNNRGGFVPSGPQRGGQFSFQAGQSNQPPGGQRSWGGRSSGHGSLFGGAASGKRKIMSPEGDAGHPGFTYPHPNPQSTSSTRHQGRYQDEEEGNDEMEQRRPPGAFKTAKQQLAINNQKKHGSHGGAHGSHGGAPRSSSYGTNRKVLGTTRRGLNSKFVPPVMNRDEDDNSSGMYGSRPSGKGNTAPTDEEDVDPRLKNIDPKMIELVNNEIMDHGPPIQWDDIAGLEFAKSTIKEIVVWPMLRPDIFNGLRGPPKGLLLFGPPGTGKTLIGKCIASQSGATFFSISASSLTSKWVGEGEKMVRALFAVARCNQPAVIFIDEIDSLLSQRSNDEHESSRRIKTEFLVQLDGATTSTEDRLLVVGATNRPQEIDEAARRRLVKRLYIPLPEGPARKQIVLNLLSQQNYSLSEEEVEAICQNTDGYSGADMANLCRESALGPIRAIQGTDIQHISADQVRPIIYDDFTNALQNVRPSVCESDLDLYLDWNKKFGSGGK